MKSSAPRDGDSGCISRLASESSRPMGSGRREIAAELAVHFERGQNYRKAVQYLQAGRNKMPNSVRLT